VRKLKSVVRSETTELVCWQSISVHIQIQQFVWHSRVLLNTTRFDGYRMKERTQRNKRWGAGRSVGCNWTSTTVSLRRS